jgi:hypothetical protein
LLSYFMMKKENLEFSSKNFSFKTAPKFVQIIIIGTIIIIIAIIAILMIYITMYAA